MSATYLELGVHHFRCALRADVVLGVVSDAPVAAYVRFRGQRLPFIDLREMFGAQATPIAPFALAIETAEERLLIGVDSVGHVQRAEVERVPVPSLGMRMPGLVTAALRLHDTLWLVLEPTGLAALQHGESATVRESTNLTPSEGGGYKAAMTREGEVSSSPSPVMTFHAAGAWLGVLVPHLERITMAQRLWPVPLASASHAGLYDDGAALVPVVDLGQDAHDPETPGMLAVLRSGAPSRDSRLAVRIDKPGRVSHDYQAAAGAGNAPLSATRPMAANGQVFWLLDTDELTRSIQKNLFTRIH